MSAAGMDRATGKAIRGDAHLRQSIADIVSTPLGTRVMRRDYGCVLADLLDRPLNRATALLASAAIAMAVARWEPRVKVAAVTLQGDLAGGQASVSILFARVGGNPTALERMSLPLSSRAIAT